MKRTLALFLALTLSLSLLAGCGGQEAQSTPAPIGTTAPTATPDAEEPTTKRSPGLWSGPWWPTATTAS